MLFIKNTLRLIKRIYNQANKIVTYFVSTLNDKVRKIYKIHNNFNKVNYCLEIFLIKS